MIPIDRQSRPTKIGTASQSKPFTLRQLAVALLPPAPLTHGLNTLVEPDRAHLEPVSGHTILGLKIVETQLGRVDPELLRCFV